MKAALAAYGYTGSINDAYRNYLLSEAGLLASSHFSINDLEKKVLALYGYTGHVNDAWMAYLGAAGYTGALDDRLNKFWEAGQGFVPFWVPLTHTAVPTRAAAGTTATFTRATTATVHDHEGVLRTMPSGCARFEGARYVRNLISAASEDFSNAAWTNLNTTVVANQAVAPDGTTTADLIYPTTSGTDRVVYQNGLVSTVIGNRLILEGYAKYAGIRWLWFGTLGGGTTANQLPFFDLQNGVVGQAGTYFDSSDIEDVGNGWYRCSAVKNTIPAAPLFPIYGMGDADGSTTATTIGTNGIYLWGAQLEDITGRADQTTPSEYVSVGVESAPYYHGSMVDGVKCFPTDLSGNPIPSTTMLGYPVEGARTNVLLHSNDLSNAAWSKPGPLAIAQNEIGVDGAISAWTLTDDNVGVDENVNQASVKTAATWTDSCYFKKTTGAQATYPVFYAFDGATRVALCTVDTTNGVATVWTAYTGLTVQPSVARCRSFNDDKWFVELSFTATAATWITTVDAAGTTNATQSTGTLNVALTGSCVVERLQSELGSFATSYIATTTIAVARNADVLTYSSAGNIDGTKGWCYAEASAQWSAATGVYNILVGIDTANRGPLLAIDNAPTAIYIADGTNAVQATGASTTFNSTSKRASTWGGSTMSVTGSGAAVASGAFDGNMNVGANITVGILDNGGSAWFGTIRNVRIGQRQLSASELQAITS